MIGESIDHIDVYHAGMRGGVTNPSAYAQLFIDVPDRKKIPKPDIIMET